MESRKDNNYRKKPVFGVGINDIDYYTRGTPVYLTWKSMLARCYSEYTRKGNPAYEGCSVCEEWKYLSKFKEWFDQNHIDGYQLDKDILFPGNKVYSPETCCFVPQEINKLFKGHARTKGVAVGVKKQYNKFVSEFRADGKRYRMSFDTLEDARDFYNKHRLMHLFDVSERCYKEKKLSRIICNAIINYGLEVYERESA